MLCGWSPFSGHGLRTHPSGTHRNSHSLFKLSNRRHGGSRTIVLHATCRLVDCRFRPTVVDMRCAPSRAPVRRKQIVLGRAYMPSVQSGAMLRSCSSTPSQPTCASTTMSLSESSPPPAPPVKHTKRKRAPRLNHGRRATSSTRHYSALNTLQSLRLLSNFQ